MVALKKLLSKHLRMQSAAHMVAKDDLGEEDALPYFRGVMHTEVAIRPPQSMSTSGDYPSPHECKVEAVVVRTGTSDVFSVVAQGHGSCGRSAATYAATLLTSSMLKEGQRLQTDAEILETMKSTWDVLDRGMMHSDLCQYDTRDSGATSTLMGVFPKRRKLFLAHAGDCRAVLACDHGEEVLEARQLTMDHLPCHPEERSRVECAGGQVRRVATMLGGQAAYGVYMHNGKSPGLLVSRCLGDTNSKSLGVTSAPSLSMFPLPSRPVFIILGNRGLWNTMTNEEAVGFVRNYAMRRDDKVSCASALTLEAQQRQARAMMGQGPQLVQEVAATVVFFEELPRPCYSGFLRVPKEAASNHEANLLTEPWGGWFSHMEGMSSEHGGFHHDDVPLCSDSVTAFPNMTSLQHPQPLERLPSSDLDRLGLLHSLLSNVNDGNGRAKSCPGLTANHKHKMQVGSFPSPDSPLHSAPLFQVAEAIVSAKSREAPTQVAVLLEKPSPKKSILSLQLLDANKADLDKDTGLGCMGDLSLFSPRSRNGSGCSPQSSEKLSSQSQSGHKRSQSRSLEKSTELIEVARGGSLYKQASQVSSSNSSLPCRRSSDSGDRIDLGSDSLLSSSAMQRMASRESAHRGSLFDPAGGAEPLARPTPRSESRESAHGGSFFNPGTDVASGSGLIRSVSRESAHGGCAYHEAISPASASHQKQQSVSPFAAVAGGSTYSEEWQVASRTALWNQLQHEHEQQPVESVTWSQESGPVARSARSQDCVRSLSLSSSVVQLGSCIRMGPSLKEADGQGSARTLLDEGSSGRRKLKPPAFCRGGHRSSMDSSHKSGSIGSDDLGPDIPVYKVRWSNGSSQLLKAHSSPAPGEMPGEGALPHCLSDLALRLLGAPTYHGLSGPSAVGRMTSSTSQDVLTSSSTVSHVSPPCNGSGPLTLPSGTERQVRLIAHSSGHKLVEGMGRIGDLSTSQNDGMSLCSQVPDDLAIRGTNSPQSQGATEPVPRTSSICSHGHCVAPSLPVVEEDEHRSEGGPQFTMHELMKLNLLKVGSQETDGFGAESPNSGPPCGSVKLLASGDHSEEDHEGLFLLSSHESLHRGERHATEAPKRSATFSAGQNNTRGLKSIMVQKVPGKAAQEAKEKLAKVAWGQREASREGPAMESILSNSGTIFKLHLPLAGGVPSLKSSDSGPPACTSQVGQGVWNGGCTRPVQHDQDVHYVVHMNRPYQRSSSTTSVKPPGGPNSPSRPTVNTGTPGEHQVPSGRAQGEVGAGAGAGAGAGGVGAESLEPSTSRKVLSIPLGISLSRSVTPVAASKKVAWSQAHGGQPSTSQSAGEHPLGPRGATTSALQMMPSSTVPPAGPQGPQPRSTDSAGVHRSLNRVSFEFSNTSDSVFVDPRGLSMFRSRSASCLSGEPQEGNEEVEPALPGAAEGPSEVSEGDLNKDAGASTALESPVVHLASEDITPCSTPTLRMMESGVVTSSPPDILSVDQDRRHAGSAQAAQLLEELTEASFELQTNPIVDEGQASLAGGDSTLKADPVNMTNDLSLHHWQNNAAALRVVLTGALAPE